MQGLQQGKFQWKNTHHAKSTMTLWNYLIRQPGNHVKRQSMVTNTHQTMKGRRTNPILLPSK